MIDEFEIRLLDWEQARPGAVLVRRSVFIEEQGVPEHLEWDELDAQSTHALCVDASGMAVATGRLIPHSLGRQAVIGRMAVLIPHRNTGLGMRVLNGLLDRAEATGRFNVELHAQVQVLSFYHRVGFRESGPEFDEAGIAHKRMILSLSNRKR